MDILIGLVLAIVVLTGLVAAAKRFVKPTEGPLPDCCNGKGKR